MGVVLEGGRFAHAEDFCLLANDFTEPSLVQLLGVSSKTLNRWRCGRSRVPWAAYQLVRDRSKYGLAERDAAENFNRTAILGLVHSLKERVAELEERLCAQARLVDWGCANDPFVDPADPRSRIAP